MRYELLGKYIRGTVLPDCGKGHNLCIFQRAVHTDAADHRLHPDILRRQPGEIDHGSHGNRPAAEYGILGPRPNVHEAQIFPDTLDVLIPARPLVSRLESVL